MGATRRLLAVMLLLSASCARSSVATDTGPRLAKDANVISQEELLDPLIVSMDAMKAIRYLRPAFFRTTGPQSFFRSDAGMLQISYDYGPVQPVAQLAAQSTLLLYEVRYLDAVAAGARFGLNANGGPVILLLSGKQ